MTGSSTRVFREQLVGVKLYSAELAREHELVSRNLRGSCSGCAR